MIELGLLAMHDVRTRVGTAREGFTLDIPRFDLALGDRVAIIGPSGSGKSLFLELLGLIRAPESAQEFQFRKRSGETLDIARLWARRDPARLIHARCRDIGFLLQTGGLLRSLSILENVLLPAKLAGTPTSYGAEMIERLGLSGQRRRRPATLSVGQRQRAALARAMSTRPTLLLADEPTAALDSRNADGALQVIVDAVEQQLVGAAVIATHDRERALRLGFREVALTSSAEGSIFASCAA